MVNEYIKKNPGKVFESPRSSVFPMAEREYVLSVGSKEIKSDVYKTWDKNLKTFVSVIEFGLPKKEAQNIFKTMAQAYGKKPFKNIKYRLTNPDFLKVRKYARLLKRGYKLTGQQKSKLRSLVQKFLDSFKELMKSKKGSLKGTIADDAFKKQDPKKPRALNVRRLVQKPIKFKITKSAFRKKRQKRAERKAKPRRKTRKATRRAKTRVSKRKITRTRPRTRPKVRPRVKASPTKRPRTRTRPRTRPKVKARPRTRSIFRTRARTLLRNRVRPIVRPRPKVRKTPKKKITRIKKRDKKKETEQERPTPRRVVKRKFIYLADLYSRFYGIQIPRKKGKFLLTPGRVFKGFEARPIVGRKR
jgi:hypothetical protein